MDIDTFSFGSLVWGLFPKSHSNEKPDERKATTLLLELFVNCVNINLHKKPLKS